jgi:hypothetical protein
MTLEGSGARGSAVKQRADTSGVDKAHAMHQGSFPVASSRFCAFRGEEGDLSFIISGRRLRNNDRHYFYGIQSHAYESLFTVSTVARAEKVRVKRVSDTQ